jgi:hypothetical protein
LIGRGQRKFGVGEPVSSLIRASREEMRETTSIVIALKSVRMVSHSAISCKPQASAAGRLFVTLFVPD